MEIFNFACINIAVVVTYLFVHNLYFIIIIIAMETQKQFFNFFPELFENNTNSDGKKNNDQNIMLLY